jgi:cytochrome P450/NADPH-cytochrome P450 reductase
LKKIPQPRYVPFLGCAVNIHKNGIIQSFLTLAQESGPIFSLTTPIWCNMMAKEVIVVTSPDLVNELSDESRFDKFVDSGPMLLLRDYCNDSLLTARTSEPNWGKAHRILKPAFSPIILRSLFDSMLDIAEQLLLKWERQGSQSRINLVDDMSKLTFDTIGLCGFNYRFNSFYQEKVHPMNLALTRILLEISKRVTRFSLFTKLMFKKQLQFKQDVNFIRNLVDEIIIIREKFGQAPPPNDLLNSLLNTPDPETGEYLDSSNIGAQIVTFLAAGHETTTSLLSFTLIALMQNPTYLQKAHDEVVRVLGNKTPNFENLHQLTYLDQIIKESLRLWPPAPVYMIHSIEEETVIGGLYSIKRKQPVIIFSQQLHRNPTIWGADAEIFNPDRMEPSAVAKLPPNVWKPFGNGQRSCIGRAFAMQEAKLILAMIIQRFDLFFADGTYKLQTTGTVVQKPENIFIHAKRRHINDAAAAAIKDEVTQNICPNNVVQSTKTGTGNTNQTTRSAAQTIHVFFGSNSGSTEAFAHRIASDATAYGYQVFVSSLDSAVNKLPSEAKVIIVSASYEGLPPNNAKNFVKWIEAQPNHALIGLNYAVLGCGSKDWIDTYQAVPKSIDQMLFEKGGERIIDRGEADASGDFFGDFERWCTTLWDAIGRFSSLGCRR